MATGKGGAAGNPAAPEGADDVALQGYADWVAEMIANPETPRPLYDALVDHVIQLSEEVELYIFAPEVVRAVYPLMCRRAAERAAKPRRRRRPRSPVESVTDSIQ